MEAPLLPLNQQRENEPDYPTMNRKEKWNVIFYGALVIIPLIVLNGIFVFEENVTLSLSHFDARIDVTDILWLNIFTTAITAVTIFIAIIHPTTANWTVGWAAYYTVLTCMVYGMGKIMLIDWTNISFNNRSIFVVSFAAQLVEMYFLPKLGCAIYERTQWTPADTTEGSFHFVKIATSVVKDDNMPRFNRDHFSVFGTIQVLKPYFWPKGIWNKLKCVLTWVFLALSKIANLMSPIYIGLAVESLHDVDAGKPVSESGVFRNLIIYCMLGLFSKVLKELQNVIYLSVKQTAYVQIARQTFEHLHKLSLEWHVKKRMGNVMRSMDRGVAAADTVVTYLFLNLVPSIVECVVVFVIFYRHFRVPALSTTAFISFVLYSIATVKITMWRKKFRVKTNQHDNELHDKATDSLINYETVKYFTAETYEADRYTESIAKYQSYSVSTSYSLSALNTAQNFIIQSCTAVCLMIGAHQVIYDQGGLSVGSFVSISVYINNLFAPLSFLGTISNMVIQAFVDMSNLSELLAESPDLVDAPDAKTLETNTQLGVPVEFQHVTFRYPTQLDAHGLQNISFKVSPGTTLAIVGPTGSGKTTISRLLFRFYDPLQGRILIADQDIKHVTQNSLRRSIGVVPQDTVLFNDTILYNVAYGKIGATMKDIEVACRGAQIWDFINSLPEGFETKVGERGLKLSGGEKQRVAIARCLLKNPPVVLLDEATSALDTVTERSVQEALNNLTDKRTTLVIAHRLSTIRNAEQIVVLEYGVLKEIGSHEELLEKHGAYYQLWNSRVEKEA